MINKTNAVYSNSLFFFFTKVILKRLIVAGSIVIAAKPEVNMVTAMSIPKFCKGRRFAKTSTKIQE